MITVSELCDKFFAAEANNQHVYRLIDVEEMRTDRSQLHLEIKEINDEIDDTDDDEVIRDLRADRNESIGLLDTMDTILANTGGNNSGFMLMKKVSSNEWHEMEFVMYVSDETEALQVHAIYNTYDLMSKEVK